MCDTCGCEGSPRRNLLFVDEIEVPLPLLAANDAAAARTRARLASAGVLCVNVLGTPGAGKTALLEATLRRLPGKAAIVVADLATENDARRLERAGAPVVAVETGTTCHLSAPLLEKALARLPLEGLDTLFVENVGNLVCPALFDLGEAAKVVLVSVTEGDDKPQKYPVIIQRASLLVLHKVDLLPHVDFSLANAATHARAVNPDIGVIAASARTGEGLELWIDWIARLRAERLAGAAAP
jgi:hydrogenase nickel incorporation protein HypB